MARPRGLVLAAALAVAGCAGAPAWQPPQLAAPSGFREADAALAASADAPAPDWWRAFGDPRLDALEDRLAADNPTLAEAAARHDAALATLRIAQADLYPALGAGAAVGYARQSDDRPLRSASQPAQYGNNLAGLGIGYEIDVWGRVRNAVAQGRANALASADDLAAIRLALAASLADAWLSLGGLDAELALLDRTIAVYAEADRVVRARLAGGVASEIDLARSATQLGDAEAQRAEVLAARAQLEHAVAALVGANPSGFALAPVRPPAGQPPQPAALPATLLQRRPDVAAAEARVFAANRAIGVARAAFFPTLDLAAAGGTNATALAGLARASDAFWAVGPSLALTVFDGGRRAAGVRAARARFAEAGAAWRGTALRAFQEVEDSLAALRHGRDEDAAAAIAAARVQDAADLSIIRYEKGASNYLDVVTAQTTALLEQRRAIAVHARHLQDWVALVRALGGGWTPPAP